MLSVVRMIQDRRKNAARLREVLSRFMEERGLKAKPWAERAGVPPTSLYNFLRGDSQSLTAETYEALAKSAHVPVEFLTGEIAPINTAVSIIIRGKVEAGSWAEAHEWPEELHRYTVAPVPKAFANTTFGLEVHGDSMDEVYPNGSVVFCINLYEYDRPLQTGDRVVVHRTRKDGLIEATLKEYVERPEGDVWLMPRSSNPKFRQAVQLNDGQTEAVEIVAVVIGSYRPERNTT